MELTQFVEFPYRGSARCRTITLLPQQPEPVLRTFVFVNPQGGAKDVARLKDGNEGEAR
jgi:hypothetical protein